MRIDRGLVAGSGHQVTFGVTDSALDALPLFERPAAAPKFKRGGMGLPFADLVQDFRQFGTPSVELREGSIRYLINEFWTSGQRRAHSLHEISYRACFKPQLPAFFVSHLIVC
jgi:hypothetical protein